MAANARLENLYQFAGIDDLAEFYRLRYASNELLDADYFDAVNRFDIRWSRTMWVYDNVRPDSVVLDLGCGAGLLALLKRKGCTVVGIDISAECAGVAMRNGYSSACAGNLTALPFAAGTFDYVISLDVMGHVEFRQKDAVLAELKRVLMPNGVTLHGVECMNREQQKDYQEMTVDELRQFVSVDGHVGMEDEPSNRRRFGRFFSHVLAEPRYSVCVPCEELVKLADDYGLPRCDEDFLDYVRGLSFNERRAFNMAMGYVFQRISDYEIKMPASGYLLVKASDQPLDNIYSEFLDRDRLQPKPVTDATSFDKSDKIAYTSGWYAAENFPPVGRWMAARSRLRFTTASLSRLRLDISCHMPDVAQRPLHLEFFLNGASVGAATITENGWQTISLPVSQPHRLDEKGLAACVFEIAADRTWQPRSTNPRSTDERELSVAVSRLVIEP